MLGIPTFEAMVVNFGFAAPISPRPVVLAVLTPDGGGVLWTGSIGSNAHGNGTNTTMPPSLADVRDWQPYAPGDPTYSLLAHQFGGRNITLHSAMRTPASPFGSEPPPCLQTPGGCSLPLALFLPDLRLQQCLECEQAAAYSIVFANDAPTLTVRTVPGVGRFNVVGQVQISVRAGWSHSL